MVKDRRGLLWNLTGILPEQGMLFEPSHTCVGFQVHFLLIAHGVRSIKAL